jgi:hypothetical protein
MTTPAGEKKKRNTDDSQAKVWLRRFFKIAIILTVAAFLYLTVRRSIDELREKARIPIGLVRKMVLARRGSSGFDSCHVSSRNCLVSVATLLSPKRHLAFPRWMHIS